MQSLWFVEPGRLEWREVPTPVLKGDTETLVRPVIAGLLATDRVANLLRAQVDAGTSSVATSTPACRRSSCAHSARDARPPFTT